MLDEPAGFSVAPVQKAKGVMSQAGYQAADNPNDITARSRWLKQLAKIKFDDADPLALPPDLELSVEDAGRKWFGE